MKFKPVHELSSDELNHILYMARQFIEWNIEPKYCQLHALIDSVKESMVYFMPDDEDLIQNINNANEASLIINTFTGAPHPLREGLTILRELYEIINANRKDLYLYQLTTKIRDYLDTIEPYVLREKLDKFHLMQSDRAKKARTRNGLSPEARQERDKKILADYDKSKSRLSLESFAKHHEKKRSYKKGNGEYLKKSAIKKIIKANHTNDT